MKRKTVALGSILLLFLLLCSAPAFATPVYVTGSGLSGEYPDADKTSSSDDDLLCWAAAASNILDYTGWGYLADTAFVDEDVLFDYYIDHWTNSGGLPGYAWEWFFTGDHSSPTSSGWASVNVSGGGYFTEELFNSVYSYSYYINGDNMLDAIVDSVDNQKGTTVEIYNDDNSGGHSLSVWGYDDRGVDGWWLLITDSDYDQDYAGWRQVTVDSGKYRLGSKYIGGVQSLALAPASQVPAPPALVLLGGGLSGVAVFRRRRKI